MAAWRQALVVGGIAAAVGAVTFIGVRSGMRKRCKKKVRKALDAIPLATDEWKSKQAKSICVGASTTSTSTNSSLASSRSSLSRTIRGQRQRKGAAISRRNVVAGEVVLSPETIEAQRVHERSRAEVLATAPLPELLDAAFDAGADSVFVTRGRHERHYSAQISAHKHEGDRGRTVHTSATAWGKGKGPEAALRDALGQLDSRGNVVEGASRRKAIKGARR